MRQYPIILEMEWSTPGAKGLRGKLYVMSDQVVAAAQMTENETRLILRTGQEFIVDWKASEIMERL